MTSLLKTVMLLPLQRGFVLAWLYASSHAQTPQTTALPADSRLSQMEEIYQQQLRALHIPILGKYLTELQKQAASATDPKPYQEEIGRLQAIINNGGLVNLNDVIRELHPETTPVEKKAEDTKRGLITLTPAFAHHISPLPAGSSSPDAAAVGHILWRIDSLPAGDYELVLQYACPKLESDLEVVVEFAGQTITQKLDSSRTTKDDRSYRLIRLGTLKIGKETTGEMLKLTAGTATDSKLLVRSFVIARSKPAREAD